MPLWDSKDTAAGKPKYLTAAEAAITYGVDVNEITAAKGSIVSLVPVNAGSGYGAVPAVTITGAGGAGATATAVVTAGKVTGANVTNVGNGAYTSATATVAAPAAYVFSGATGVNTGTDEITVTGHTFDVGDKVVYSTGGGTAITPLVNGTAYYISSFTTNTVTLSLVDNGPILNLTAAGVGASHSLTGETATLAGSLNTASSGIPHTGWVKRTVGTGGRAGRIQYEVMVAGGMTLDAADDLVFPDA